METEIDWADGKTGHDFSQTVNGAPFCTRCGQAPRYADHECRGMNANESGAARLTFGDALERLKSGDRVARDGWNGKGMWLVLIDPGNAVHRSSAGSFDMQPCIGMKTAQGNMQPGWLASQADMLADDWVVVTS